MITAHKILVEMREDKKRKEIGDYNIKIYNKQND